MKFSTSLLTLGAFVGLTSAKLQVVVVHDVSQGDSQGSAYKTAFLEGLEKTLASLTETDIEVALATSVDKPLPGVGIGTYGAYPNGRAEDYCYRREVDFTTNFASIRTALNGAVAMNGLDEYQGQLEAAVNALYDPGMKWDSSAEHLIITATDNWAHVDQDETLLVNVPRFNQPVRCTANGTEGGFGSKVHEDVPLFSWYESSETYAEYARLHEIRACQSVGLTAAEQDTYSTLRASFPVRQWPTIKPYDVDSLVSDSDAHCRFHHYPTYQQVTAAFLEKGAKWIVFHAGGSYGSVWQWTVGSEEWGFSPTPMAVVDIPNINDMTAEKCTETLTEAFKQLEIGQ